MQYEVQSPEEYLAELPEDWRKEKLIMLRSMLFAQLPDIQEIISYKMLGYQLGADVLFHLNSQKHYVSFYLGNIEKIPHAKEDLIHFKYGKGCLYIRKSTSLNDAGFLRFFDTLMQQVKHSVDFYC